MDHKMRVTSFLCLNMNDGVIKKHKAQILH